MVPFSSKNALLCLFRNRTFWRLDYFSVVRETGTSSTDWTKLSRFHLKTELRLTGMLVTETRDSILSYVLSRYKKTERQFLKCAVIPRNKVTVLICTAAGVRYYPVLNLHA
jgi:hypothetical protein